MPEVVEVQYKWKYTPENYIEDPILLEEDGYEIAICDGKALAKIEPSFHSKNLGIKEYLGSIVESKLQAIQILSHRDFTLSKPSRNDLRSDGTKNIFVEVETIKIKVTTGPVDLVIKDKDGNVIEDTKRERLNKQKWFSETVVKYRSEDSTLDQMLKSYQMAVKDPKNELVHLYEIRDALATRFGNRKNAMKHLCLSNSEWDILGNLANQQPLEEGRHRGKAVGELRSAEKHELEKARKSASNMVEKYLKYLDTN